MRKMLSTALLTLFAVSSSFAAPSKNAGRPDVKIGFEDIKLNGDCYIEAKISNFNRLFVSDYHLQENTIGFGTATCKDGSRAFFTLHEKQITKKEGGLHAVNISGFIDGTAEDIYGTYGYFKKMHILPAFWTSLPLPLGYGILAMTKSPKSKPMILFGMAFGIEISEHMGAMRVQKISRAKYQALLDRWEGKFDGESIWDRPSP